MADHDRGESSTRTPIAYLTGVVACADGAAVTRMDGVVAIMTGLPFDWFDQILIDDDEAAAAGVLAAIARARDEDRPFVVRLRDGVDDRLIPTLAAVGLVPQDATSRTPGTRATDTPASHLAGRRRGGSPWTGP